MLQYEQELEVVRQALSILSSKSFKDLHPNRRAQWRRQRNSLQTRAASNRSITGSPCEFVNEAVLFLRSNPEVLTRAFATDHCMNYLVKSTYLHLRNYARQELGLPKRKNHCRKQVVPVDDDLSELPHPEPEHWKELKGLWELLDGFEREDPDAFNFLLDTHRRGRVNASEFRKKYDLTRTDTDRIQERIRKQFSVLFPDEAANLCNDPESDQMLEEMKREFDRNCRGGSALFIRNDNYAMLWGRLCIPIGSVVGKQAGPGLRLRLGVEEALTALIPFCNEQRLWLYPDFDIIPSILKGTPVGEFTDGFISHTRA